MATDAKRFNTAEEIEDERQKLLQHLQDRVNTADNDMTDLARAFDDLNAKLTDGSEWVVVTKGQDIDDNEKENSHFAKLKEIEEKKLKALKSLSKLIHFIHADREDICAKESLKTCTDLKIDSYLDDINPDSVKKKGDTLIELLEEQNERLQQKYMLARDHVKIVSDREKLVRDAYDKLSDGFKKLQSQVKAGSASKDTGVAFLETHFDDTRDVSKNEDAKTTHDAGGVEGKINKNKNQHNGQVRSNASMQQQYGDTSSTRHTFKPDGTMIELTDVAAQTANTTPLPDDPEKMAADSTSIDTVDTEVQTTIDLVNCGMQTDATNELEGESQQSDSQLQERVKQLEQELAGKDKLLQTVYLVDFYEINIYTRKTTYEVSPESHLRTCLVAAMNEKGLRNKVNNLTELTDVALEDVSIVCCVAKPSTDWNSLITEVASKSFDFKSTAIILMYDSKSKEDCERALGESFGNLQKFGQIFTAPYILGTICNRQRDAIIRDVIEFLREKVVPTKKVINCPTCYSTRHRRY